MNNILSNILKERGIDSYDDLSDEEKLDFDKWEKVLASDEIRPENMVDFCNLSISAIEPQFKDADISNEKLRGLVLQHAIYKSLLGMITGPKAERESLVSYLTSLQ